MTEDIAFLHILSLEIKSGASVGIDRRAVMVSVDKKEWLYG